MSEDLADIQGLALGMGIAAILTIPFLFKVVPEVQANPELLLKAFLISLVGLSIPYALEYVALSNMKAKVFSILYSCEPLLAAFIGILLLGDVVSFRSFMAFCSMSVASFGAVIFEPTDDEEVSESNLDTSVGDGVFQSF